MVPAQDRVGCDDGRDACENAATEDLAFMLNEAGFETGIDVGGLRKAVAVAERLTDQQLGGRITKWWVGQAGEGAATTAEAAA